MKTEILVKHISQVESIYDAIEVKEVSEKQLEKVIEEMAEKAKSKSKLA